MIESYQAMAAVEKSAAEPVSAGCVAEVAEVGADGLRLILPGETAAGSKWYPCNTACSFAAGQRVYFVRAGNTKIVICPIGGGTAWQTAST